MRNFAIICLLFFTTPVMAAPPNWTIDKTQSSIAFSGTAMSRPFTGHFKNFDGEIVFDPAQVKQSHVAITIDTKSVTTDNDDANQNIDAPEWLNSAAVPNAVFKADKFEKRAEGQYIAHGTLTLRGISVPVDLPFTLNIQKTAGSQTAKVTGEATLHRLDFGLGSGTYSDAKTVGLDVKTQISLTARAIAKSN